MKVGPAFTGTVFAGSNADPRKDGERAFDGVLSSVANEASGPASTVSAASQASKTSSFELKTTFAGTFVDRTLDSKAFASKALDEASDPKGSDPKSVDPKSVDPKTVDPKTVDPKTVDPKTVDPKTVDPKSVDPETVDPKAVDPKSVDPKPVDSKSVDTKSVDPRALDPLAIGAKTIDAKIAETSDAKTSDAKTADPKAIRAKAPDADTSAARATDDKIAETEMPDLTNWVAAAPLTKPGSAGSTSRPRESTAIFVDPNDKPDRPVEQKTEAAADPTASNASNASLLALVQIAAFAPPPPPPPPAPSTPVAVASAAAPTAITVPNAAPATLGPSDSSALLVKAATTPLVGGIKFESHLTPAEATTGSTLVATGRTASALPTAASPTPGPAPTPPPQAKAREVVPPTDQVETEIVPGGSDRIAVSPPVTIEARPEQSGDHATGGERHAVENAEAGSDASAVAPVAAQPDASLTGLAKATLGAPSLAVVDAVTSLASQATTRASAASVAPARTMLLQLSPGDLGTVNVRLHLTGHTLDVSLTASNADTASLLDHDRAALAGALGDRDYQLNSLVIQGGDAASTPGGSSASTESSGNRSASQSMGDQDGGGNARGGARDPSPRRNAPDRGPVSAAVRGDALFV